MIETLHPTPRAMPKLTCETCLNQSDTQVYTIVLERSKVTREWVFCSLSCLRAWAKPV